ncbi:hypothetical protein CXB51_030664 [Gossypium anomalum]|uniref:RING-type domain-containing protein n=1 Tax=Gossypium anomalum TaxID=47600 RepID=A0A8J5YB26_9ROSI|nr:hypothetical protein CXB51_030664 [Gossypium anomalum]
MDDSCVVCADNLEWVAYGACGHRDVCSTCVARLRFICNDRRCCICKTESNDIFVTKALGDYTRMINDFSVLPTEVREGRVGSYWYHEDTQAFFDDVDNYRMIKAMCRLSCSVCDKIEEQSNAGIKRRGKFRNIEQLKGHLFHQHRLVMCSLCLEGRKVFICEQRLYTRAQLNQHINTGDSEVDGTESERGGFMGHPIVILTHVHRALYMSYLPKIHFRRDHYLCEDETCLAKKFIVFQSEAELKRHNTIEHGGRTSRAQRSAALQIPTSFRYRQRNDDTLRGRERTSRYEPSDNDHRLSMAIEASLETASDPPASSCMQADSDCGDINDIYPLVQPFELLSAAVCESSSRYLQALGGGSRGAPLQGTSFPPLSTPASTSQQTPKHRSDGLPINTMAAHLRHRKNANTNVLSSAQEWPETRHRLLQAASRSSQVRPATNVAAATSLGNSNGFPQLSSASSTHAQIQVQFQPTTADILKASGSRMSEGSTSRINHSSSARNLADGGFSGPSLFDFPPVSAAQRHESSSSQVSISVEDVHTTNKSLVEKMRAALTYDEEKYIAFKEISGRYHQGLISTGRYFDYVQQYGLSHLVLELARLYPDAQKQKELIETYNAGLRGNDQQVNGDAQGNDWFKDNNASKKWKGKSLDTTGSNTKDTMANSIMSSVRKFQSSHKPSEEVEVLSKDDYRPAKGNSRLMVNEQPVELNSTNKPSIKVGGQNDSLSAKVGPGDAVGGSKQRKKTSNFHREQLGDAPLNLKVSKPDPDPEALDNNLDTSQISTRELPVRDVW